MSDDGFLQEIRSNPEDSVPRLIYADWLEENGDPLAELIRVQCQLADEGAGSDVFVELKRRQDELMEAYHHQVIRPLKKLDLYSFDMRRGFVESIRLDALTFIENAEEIVALIPALCAVTFRKSSQHWQELLNCPYLAQVPSIAFRSAFLTDQHLFQLLESKYISNVFELELTNNKFTDRAAMAIAESDRLPKLRSLVLNANDIGSRGFNAIGRSTQLDQLTRLCVQNCGIKSIARAARRSLPNLTQLDLGENPIPNDSLSDFLDQPRKLKVLNLTGMQIDPDVLDTEHLSQLESLNLKGTGVGVNGLGRILSLSPMRNLRQFEAVRSCQEKRRNTTHQSLETAQVFKLRLLDLTNNNIGYRPLNAFAKSACLGELRHLRLSSNTLTTAALSKLLGSGLDNLRTLSITNCDRLEAEKFLPMLAEWPGLSQLSDVFIDVRHVLDWSRFRPLDDEELGIEPDDADLSPSDEYVVVTDTGVAGDYPPPRPHEPMVRVENVDAILNSTYLSPSLSIRLYDPGNLKVMINDLEQRLPSGFSDVFRFSH